MSRGQESGVVRRDATGPHGTAAIDRAFARGREQKRALFIPYITAGDPDLATTETLLDALVAGGADLVELGVPFSDPIADGPVNQRAAFRALGSGTDLPGVLDVVSRFRTRSPVPVVLFTYFNPIHARGVEAFAQRASTSGVDGVLCVDLPPEEGEDLAAALAAKEIASIYLLAPTSTRERIRLVGRSSSGFVYYVSRTGVTGEQGSLPEELVRELEQLRRRIKLPLAVGFGISSPEQVEALGRYADGVVVGSALVRVVEEAAGAPDVAARLEERVAELAGALRRTRR
jgi:tryptophan synthase alpha chain